LSSFVKNPKHRFALKKVLPLFSYIFHPIFIPVFGTLFYLSLNENYLIPAQQYLILIQISILTVFIPLCFFFLLKTLGKADSVMLSDLSQRKIPLVIQAALLFILTAKSITEDTLPELHYFFVGGLISSLLALVLLFARIKASLHMIGIAALTAFVVGLSMHNQANAIYIIAALALANGLIAASRLEMQAHTGKELLIGFFAGLLPQVILWYFWL